MEENISNRAWGEWREMNFYFSRTKLPVITDAIKIPSCKTMQGSYDQNACGTPPWNVCPWTVTQCSVLGFWSYTVANTGFLGSLHYYLFVESVSFSVVLVMKISNYLNHAQNFKCYFSYNKASFLIFVLLFIFALCLYCWYLRISSCPNPESEINMNTWYYGRSVRNWLLVCLNTWACVTSLTKWLCNFCLVLTCALRSG